MKQRICEAVIYLILILTAGTVRADTLTFSSLGFSIETPVGWRLLSVSERADANKDWDYGGDELNRLVKSNQRKSLLAIIAKGLDNPRVNPGIYLDFHEEPTTDINAALNSQAIFISEHAQEPRFLETPSLTTVGDFEAGHLAFTYAISGGGMKVRVLEHLWMVPLSEGYLTISGGAEEGRDSEAIAGIVNAVRSLKRL